MTDGTPDLARITMSHHIAHTSYIDIEIGSEEKALIEERKDLPPSQVHYFGLHILAGADML